MRKMQFNHNNFMNGNSSLGFNNIKYDNELFQYSPKIGGDDLSVDGDGDVVSDVTLDNLSYENTAAIDGDGDGDGDGDDIIDDVSDVTSDNDSASASADLGSFTFSDDDNVDEMNDVDEMNEADDVDEKGVASVTNEKKPKNVSYFQSYQLTYLNTLLPDFKVIRSYDSGAGGDCFYYSILGALILNFKVINDSVKSLLVSRLKMALAEALTLDHVRVPFEHILSNKLQSLENLPDNSELVETFKNILQYSEISQEGENKLEELFTGNFKLDRLLAFFKYSIGTSGFWAHYFEVILVNIVLQDRGQFILESVLPPYSHRMILASSRFQNYNLVVVTETQSIFYGDLHFNQQLSSIVIFNLDNIHFQSVHFILNGGQRSTYLQQGSSEAESFYELYTDPNRVDRIKTTFESVTDDDAAEPAGASASTDASGVQVKATKLPFPIGSPMKEQMTTVRANSEVKVKVTPDNIDDTSAEAGDQSKEEDKITEFQIDDVYDRVINSFEDWNIRDLDLILTSISDIQKLNTDLSAQELKKVLEERRALMINARDQFVLAVPGEGRLIHYLHLVKNHKESQLSDVPIEIQLDDLEQSLDNDASDGDGDAMSELEF